MTQRVGTPDAGDDDVPINQRATGISPAESAHRQSVIQWARTGTEPSDVFVSPMIESQDASGQQGQVNQRGPVSTGLDAQRETRTLTSIPEFQPFPDGPRSPAVPSRVDSAGQNPSTDQAPWDLQDNLQSAAADVHQWLRRERSRKGAECLLLGIPSFTTDTWLPKTNKEWW